MDEHSARPEPTFHHDKVPDVHRLETATATFRMLADPTRLHLLWLLTQAPADVTELVERTGASRTSVSQHLAKLRFSGLVTTTRQSRHMIYSISDGHLVRLILEGLNYADHQVTGEAPHE